MLDAFFLHAVTESTLAALHFVALFLLIVTALAWGRHSGRRALVASAFAIVSAIVIVFAASVQPRDIPIDWITILHEGVGYQAIQHLDTHGVHAGHNYHAFLSLIAGSTPSLFDVVWLNLLLGLINAAIFAHVAMYIAGPIWGIAWTLAFALNPASFFASFSELPTNMLGLYGLAGIIAWAVVKDPLRQPPLLKGVAYLLCLVLTLLMGMTRSEAAIIGATALGLDAAYAVLGASRWSDLWQRLASACEKPLAFLAAHPAVVAILCVLGVWLTQSGLPGLVGRPAMAGLYPFNPSILSLFVFLPMLMLPIGVGIAVLCGYIHATVHFRAFGGLALSLLLIVRMYFASQGQYQEAGRYLSYAFPFIFVLGPFGATWLDASVRHWRPTWYNCARVAYVMTWFTRALPGTPDFYIRPEYFKEAGVSQIFLDRNTQREIRHLLRVTENNPECVFIGRVIENYPHRPHEYAYAVFGRPIPHPIFVSERTSTIETVVERYASHATCVRLYAGGDCTLTSSDHCAQFIDHRRLIEEERFWSRPYNNPFDYGHAEPEVVLAVYAWP